MSRRIKVAPRKASKYLPNASTLGYGKYKACPGDLVVYKEHHTDGSYSSCIARVIGVIVETDTDGPDGAGKLCVVAFSDDGSFGYERWLDLEDIISCKRPDFTRHFMGWALSATPEALMKYIRDDMETRAAASHKVHIVRTGLPEE